MTRKVFFSFHYETDIWRADQVLKSWATRPDREAAGFWDAATWDEIKSEGDEVIKTWIRYQLKGTSVTVVLIGTDTSTRKYVQYEIEQSWEKGNGLVGAYIHNITDSFGRIARKGEDPFAPMGYKFMTTYDWVLDKGRDYLDDWVESAHLRAQSRSWRSVPAGGSQDK